LQGKDHVDERRKPLFIVFDMVELQKMGGLELLNHQFDELEGQVVLALEIVKDQT